MKILILSLLALLSVPTVPNMVVKDAPEYVKWGSVAVEEARKRYSAEIIDYKHIGRTNLTQKKCEEKFKLWLRKSNGVEFGILVLIQFDPSTERIQAIQFSEVNR